MRQLYAKNKGILCYTDCQRRKMCEYSLEISDAVEELYGNVVQVVE